MSDKSGETRKERDIWGNEKEVHYDSGGHKIGETRFTESFFGGSKQEHFDASGNKMGETRREETFFGSDKAVHYDAHGNKVGSSRNETDFFGTEVQRHYDSSNRQVGETRREEGWFGGSKKVHSGTYFKASEGSNTPSSPGVSNHDYNSFGSSTYQRTNTKFPGIIVLFFIAILVSVCVWAIIGFFNSTSQTTDSIYTSVQPSVSAQQSDTIIHSYYRFYLDTKKPVNQQIETNLGIWIKENLGLKMRWISNTELKGLWSTGYLDIEDYITIGNDLWAVGDQGGYGFIIHSADYGNTWELQFREPDSLFGGYYPFVVYFSNQSQGWVGTKDGLLYTQDSGKTWEFRNVQGHGNYVNRYWFYIYNTGCIDAAFAYGGIYRSNDGGKTWVTLKEP